MQILYTNLQTICINDSYKKSFNNKELLEFAIISFILMGEIRCLSLFN